MKILRKANICRLCHLKFETLIFRAEASLVHKRSNMWLMVEVRLSYKDDD